MLLNGWNTWRSASIIEADLYKSLLGKFKQLTKVSICGRIIGMMTDSIDATLSVGIVDFFHIVSAHALSLGAVGLLDQAGFVGGSTESNLVLTAIDHLISANPAWLILQH